MYDDDVAVAVDLLARGSIDVEPLISEIVPFEQTPAAFEHLVDPARTLTKLLVDIALDGRRQR
jgi:threonine dehydrogenase-like Zn-dependent dehydrogenase